MGKWRAVEKGRGSGLGEGSALHNQIVILMGKERKGKGRIVGKGKREGSVKGEG